MKRVLSLLLILAAPLVNAQTAAPPSQQELLETVNILKGRVDDLTDARNTLEKQVRDLQSKLDELTAKVAKPTGNYASQEDLKSLKAAIEEVDKKRQADNENIVATLKDIAKVKTPAPAPQTHVAPHSDTPSTPTVTPAPDGPGFNYKAQPNDTLKKIANKFNEAHPDAKITVDEILKANPALKGDPKNLKEGQKLFIPSAKGTDGAGN